MGEGVICKTCRSEGEKSKVSEMEKTRTLMGVRTFHDEDGRRHHHDPNWITTDFRCSRGHEWTTKIQKKCWCQTQILKEHETALEKLVELGYRWDGKEWVKG